MAKSKSVTLSPQEKSVRDSKRQAEKADKFKELASARVSKLLAQIENVQRLSNRNSYVYTPEQVQRIMGALETAFKGLDHSFKSTAAQAKSTFTL